MLSTILPVALKKTLLCTDAVTVSFSTIVGVEAYTQKEILENLTPDLSSPTSKIALWISALYLFTRLIFYIINNFYASRKTKMDLDKTKFEFEQFKLETEKKNKEKYNGEAKKKEEV